MTDMCRTSDGTQNSKMAIQNDLKFSTSEDIRLYDKNKKLSSHDWTLLKVS